MVYTKLLSLVILILILNAFYISTTLARPTEQADWIDLVKITPWQQSVTYSGSYQAPAVTLLTLDDDQLAVVVSQITPSINTRNDNWHKNLRVIFSTKDQQKVTTNIAGESIGKSADNWISALTYLPSSAIDKSNVEQIIVQTVATPALIATQKLAEKNRH